MFRAGIACQRDPARFEIVPMNPLVGLLQSRKTWAALFATFLIGVPIVLGWSGWTKDQKQQAVTTATYAVAGIWGIKIASVAYEDGQQKSAPSQQVNVGSDVKNSTTAPAAPAVAAPPVAVASPPTPQPQSLMVTPQQAAAIAERAAQAAVAAWQRQQAAAAPQPPRVQT